MKQNQKKGAVPWRNRATNTIQGRDKGAARDRDSRDNETASEGIWKGIDFVLGRNREMIRDTRERHRGSQIREKMKYHPWECMRER